MSIFLGSPSLHMNAILLLKSPSVNLMLTSRNKERQNKDSWKKAHKEVGFILFRLKQQKPKAVMSVSTLISIYSVVVASKVN